MIVFKADKNWRFSTYVITAVLVILGFMVLRYADKHLLLRATSVIDSGRPKLLSLGGVVFRMPSEEAMVFPSNYISKEDKRARVPNVQNFSLCAHLPDFTFHDDSASLRNCRQLSEKANDWMIVAVEGYGFGLPPPAPEKNPAETPGTGLAGSLRVALERTHYKTRENFGYVEGADLYGLHMFYPTKELEPNTETLFWDGPIRERVVTLIECSVYLPQQKSLPLRFGGVRHAGMCTHQFYLPSAMFGGYPIVVKLYYSHHWLPQWKFTESKSREAVLALRTDPTTIKEGK